jgi:hypothetical protein
MVLLRLISAVPDDLCSKRVDLRATDKRLIEPDDHPRPTFSGIECVQRLGGMLRFYHRAAAQRDSQDIHPPQRPVSRESGQHAQEHRRTERERSGIAARLQSVASLGFPNLR